jgi:hypothetical protein
VVQPLAEAPPVSAAPFTASFSAPSRLEAKRSASDIASSLVVALVSSLPGLLELQPASAATEQQNASEPPIMLIDLMMRPLS